MHTYVCIIHTYIMSHTHAPAHTHTHTHTHTQCMHLHVHTHALSLNISGVSRQVVLNEKEERLAICVSILTHTHTRACSCIKQGAALEQGGGAKQRGISRAHETATQRSHAQPVGVVHGCCRFRPAFHDLDPQTDPVSGDQPPSTLRIMGHVTPHTVQRSECFVSQTPHPETRKTIVKMNRE